jgi:hypothetical protein
MDYYILQIAASDEKVDDVSRILGMNPNDCNGIGWRLEIKEQDVPQDSNFVDYFLLIMEGKYDKLKEIGVDSGDISIWMLYEYDQQCNMEFEPELLLKMGGKGIIFCISCWQKDSVIHLGDGYIVDSKTWYVGDKEAE